MRPATVRFACCVLALCLPRLLVAQSNERGLWQLWQRHEASPAEHEALLEACAAFTAADPSDAFAAVSSTLAAWHLLKLGRLPEARELLAQSMASLQRADPVRKGASELAAAWLTRMDREPLKEALRFYYRREVRYPRNLRELIEYEGLPGVKELRLKDRWGDAWNYRRVGFKTMPGLLDQKYELTSRRLGDSPDLAESLAIPLGSRISLEPSRIGAAAQGEPVVEMKRQDDSSAVVIVKLGEWSGGIYLAYVGRYILVVCDTCHWKVLPRPDAR